MDNVETKCWVCGNVIDTQKDQPVRVKTRNVDGVVTYSGWAHSRCFVAWLTEWGVEFTRSD